MTELVIVEGDSGTINVIESSAAPTIIEVVSPGPKGDPGDIGSGAVTSVNGVTPVSGVITLTKSDLGLSSVENKSSSTIRSELTYTNVVTALSYDPLPDSYVPSWSVILGKPSFSAVATSGAYSDLSGRPSLAVVATSGNYSDLTGTPTAYSLPTASNTTLGGVKVDGTTIVIVGDVISAVGGGGGGGSVAVKDEGSTLTAAATSLDFVGGGVTAAVVGSAVTITIPSYALTSGGIGAALGYTPLADTYTPTWSTVTGKPSFAAVATSGAKADVGLGNVDNTSDINKPISTATQISLNAKQATLVSGTNIKTINGQSVLGSGDLTVGSSLANTDALTEGSTNLYFTVARVRATVLTGLSLVSNAAVTATNTFLEAIGLLQKQVTDLTATVNTKAPTSNPTFTGTITLPSQAQNVFFAAPNGVAGVPTWRSIVAGDIPTLNQNTTGTASNVTGIVLGVNGGTGIANTGKTITLGGNFATSGAYPLTLTLTGSTTLTLPTSGTLATTGANTFSGTQSLNNNVISSIKYAGFNAELDAGNSSTAVTINFANGQKQKVTLNAATPAITISAPPAVGHYQLRIIQDATGGRVPSWVGLSASRWLSSTSAPAINLAANGETILNIFFDGANLVQSLSKVGAA